MHIFGCDFHTRFQQIAMMDFQTGEILERRLDHEAGEARKFYAALLRTVQKLDLTEIIGGELLS